MDFNHSGRDSKKSDVSLILRTLAISLSPPPPAQPPAAAAPPEPQSDTLGSAVEHNIIFEVLEISILNYFSTLSKFDCEHH